MPMKSLYLYHLLKDNEIFSKVFDYGKRDIFEYVFSYNLLKNYFKIYLKN